MREGPILRGLWLPPVAELEPDEDAVAAALRLVPGRLGIDPRLAPPVRHSMTHRRITVSPVRLEAPANPPQTGVMRWAYPESPALPTSSLLAKLDAAIRAMIGSE